jgi:hypothetical protein
MSRCSSTTFSPGQSATPSRIAEPDDAVNDIHVDLAFHHLAVAEDDALDLAGAPSA